MLLNAALCFLFLALADTGLGLLLLSVQSPKAADVALVLAAAFAVLSAGLTVLALLTPCRC